MNQIAFNPQLRYLRHKLTHSFWFLPTLIAMGGIVLSYVTLSSSNDAWPARQIVGLGLFPLSTESARLVLSTVTASSVTITSLVFSMTLIMLSQATQQLGPRLLVEFRGSRANQTVLGTFVATIAFSLVALTMSESSVPVLTVACATVLMLVCVALLVFFIHHVSRLLEADQIIALVSEDMFDAIPDSFTSRDDFQNDAPHATAEDGLPGSDVARIRASETGYVQTLDHDILVDLASTEDLRIELFKRPGHFVVKGATIGTVVPQPPDSDEFAAALARAIVIGRHRTPAQDVEYSIKAIVEVALRALSPGFNDVFTAVTCIDRLGAALAEVMQHVPLPAHTVDRRGQVRVILSRVTFSGLIDSSFNEIRQNAEGAVPALIRLAETLSLLAEFIVEKEHLDALTRHADKVAWTASVSVAEPNDKADVEHCLRNLRKQLAHADERLQDRPAPNARG